VWLLKIKPFPAIAILVLIVGFPASIVFGTQDDLIISMSVIMDGRPVDAYIYVMTLMPQGFTYFTKVNALGGSAVVRLSLGSLLTPWREEYTTMGRFALPYISLVALSQDRAGLGFVTVDEGEFTGPVLKRAVIELTQERSLEFQASSDVGPLDGPALLDWYESDNYIATGELRTNPNAWGSLTGAYYTNSYIGFSVNAFFTSWSLYSYYWVLKNAAGSDGLSVPRGSLGYVWMKVKYRWELWGTEQGNRWHYLYIKDFYPETVDATLQKLGNEAQIEEWIYDGQATSTSPYIHIFWRLVFNITRESSSVDAMWFTNLLHLIGKIPKYVLDAALVASLLINVDFVYTSFTAFIVEIYVYADAGTTHRLYYIKDYYNGLPYPAYYWKVEKV